MSRSEFPEKKRSEFPESTDTVLVRKVGNAVILEPMDEWPAGYFEALGGVPDDFVRPPQGEVEPRVGFD